MRLARLSSLDGAQAAPKGAVQALLDEATLALPLQGIVDLGKEKERLRRELDKVAGEITKLERKLEDASFVSRAPEDVVEEHRERLADSRAAHDKLSQALARLTGAA
jgi:valyl-tRNA synthetase